MTCNLEKYMPHLARFDLTHQQKEELLRILWGMMTLSVDSAFHQHPVQQAKTIETPEQKGIAKRSQRKVDSDSALLHPQFFQAAYRPQGGDNV